MYCVDVLLNGGNGVFIPTALCVKPIVCQFDIRYGRQRVVPRPDGPKKLIQQDQVYMEAFSLNTNVCVRKQAETNQTVHDAS